MGKLNISSNYIQPSTAIPNIFFDSYMLRCNGEFLKVYLYLFRHSSDTDMDISLASIADTLSMTEGDVLRALRYWGRVGLVCLDFSENGVLSGIALNSIPPLEKSDEACDPLSPMAAAHASANASSPVTPAFASDSCKDFTKPSYTMQQISDFSRENHGEQLFFVLQQYIGRPLSQTDINTIVFFHEKLGFSIDLIEYLFEYCASNSHRSLHYIEKVAISWAEEGIDTVSKAKLKSTYYNKTYFSVLKAFGINGRNPAQSEIAYIKRWHEDYCFPLPLILEACNRTMRACHSPSFEYTERILKNWKDNKVTNLDDVKALDEAYEQAKKKTAKSTAAQQKPPKSSGNNKFHNFNQRTYDYSELEQKLAKKIQGGTKD